MMVKIQESLVFVLIDCNQKKKNIMSPKENKLKNQTLMMFKGINL